MQIEIDTESGFCHGVTTAIRKAEEELAHGAPLYCLGDIVHNGQEVDRLHRLGLETVTHADLDRLQGAKVLFRAHGEPPETYEKARERSLTLIDATCPVVLHLQRRIKAEYDGDTQHLRQIVIYGKRGHAEVVGLVGQTQGTAIVIENEDDAARLLDFTRPVSLYSQTTKSLDGFQSVVAFIRLHARSCGQESGFRFYDTICRQVANRMPNIRLFARRHDVVLFVSGKKSSNGHVLFDECRRVNPRTHIIESPSEIQPEWFAGAVSIGICGATSTPKWLMEQCGEALRKMLP